MSAYWAGGEGHELNLTTGQDKGQLNTSVVYNCTKALENRSMEPFPNSDNVCTLKAIQSKSTSGLTDNVNTVNVPYRVLACSSYSSGYRPELILYEDPSNQASRWSSASNDQHQYLTIALNCPAALVTGITFGKFYKNHVCNLREFKVYVAYCPTLSLTGELDRNFASPANNSTNKLNVSNRANSTNNTKTFDSHYTPDWKTSAPILDHDLGLEGTNDGICNSSIEKDSHVMDNVRWTLALHSGLQNNSISETFPLVYPAWDNGVKRAFPINLIKIVPLAAWGNSFNYSIWHVALSGIMDRHAIAAAQSRCQSNLDQSAWRLCLRFLHDQPEYQDICSLIAERTGIILQDPLVSLLEKILVYSPPSLTSDNRSHPTVSLSKSGNSMDVDVHLEDSTDNTNSTLKSRASDHDSETNPFEAAEVALLNAFKSSNGTLFNEYIDKSVPVECSWLRLDTLPPLSPNASKSTFLNSKESPLHSTTISNNKCDKELLNNSINIGSTCNTESTLSNLHDKAIFPVGRGGHQMVWDPLEKMLYLFGGWDAHRDLSDFWRYDPALNKWTCLSEDTRREGGPTPRSCHKILIHPGRRRLYVFGRYLDNEARAAASRRDGLGSFANTESILSAEFYYYDLVKHTWTLVSTDTALQGGPSLLYDHQMVLDEEKDTIYVFGGRQLSQPSSTIRPSSISDRTATAASQTSQSANQPIQPGNTSNAPNILSNSNNTIISASASANETLNNSSNPGRSSNNHTLSNNDHGQQQITSLNNPADEALQQKSHAELVTSHLYSGLFSYSIEHDTWRLIRNDLDDVSFHSNSSSSSSAKGVRRTALRSRIGHAMVFNPILRQLYIYAGQRHKEHLCDFYTYDVDTDQVLSLAKETSRVGGPDSGYTQRACFDIGRQEMFLFSGSMFEKTSDTGTTNSTSSNAPNSSQGNRSNNNNNANSIVAAGQGVSNVANATSVNNSTVANTTRLASTSPSVVESARNTFWLYRVQMGEWKKLNSKSNARMADSISDSVSNETLLPPSSSSSSSSSSYQQSFPKINSNAPNVNTDSQGIEANQAHLSVTKLIQSASDASLEEPSPRFAHQLVYNEDDKVYYLFGGNPGFLSSSPTHRLNDLWQMRLVRSTDGTDVMRRVCFLLRKQRLYEMCIVPDQSTAADRKSAKAAAMQYLQKCVSTVVDHSDEWESAQFRRLSSWLLLAPSTSSVNKNVSINSATSNKISYSLNSPNFTDQSYNHILQIRKNLFSRIISLLPASMRPPQSSITDLIPNGNN